MADAAAFGRSPLSYDSACFAVAVSGVVPDAEIVSGHRALGAPLVFIIHADRVTLWTVRVTASATNRPTVLLPAEVEKAFKANAEAWNPASLLRAKNIGPVTRQLDFIDLGLIPALEQNILEKLDPLLRSTFFAALTSYQQRHTVAGRPDWLFRLVFRVLAGKVMTDRRLRGFERFVSNPDADELLAAVNKHFGDNPHLNADIETRRLVVDRFWEAFSFKNMSVPVLSFVWENTLVDEAVRKELSLYGTPPGVARYIVNRLGFEDIPDGRFVLEPCCGSATFLLASMRRLVDFLPPDRTDEQRHEYLRSRLAGFDIDAFGLEVARDCLMLADYPASNGWMLKQEDVFEQPAKAPAFHECLKRAAVVLCNPPYGKFASTDKRRYAARTIFKPIELINRVLDMAPADCTLGLVMPHPLVSGQSYPEVRRRLAARYGSIEIVNLPDQGVFSAAEYETVILVAREPRATGVSATVLHRNVEKGDWLRFNKLGTVSNEDSQIMTVEEARDGLAVPALQAVWQHLRDHPTVEQATGGETGRGIEWNIPVRKNSQLLSFGRAEGRIQAWHPSIRKD